MQNDLTCRTNYLIIYAMITPFAERVERINPEFLVFDKLETLQVNLGYLCNQYCSHCHVNAGPSNNRMMSKGVMEKIIDFLRYKKGISLDITGGAPELHPEFKFFVEGISGLTPRLMVRTNLTVFSEEGMEGIPQWYRDHHVVLIASLPCYTKENVDKQRGRGVFEKSIAALRRLNGVGYGESLELNLAYNPGADFLPGSQRDLERDYKKELFENYGIRFHHLFTITNMPLGRFRDYLESNNRFEQYVHLLAENFNPDATPNIMCRSLISVDWQGILYNCDFNQAAGLPIMNESGKIQKIDDIQEATQGGMTISVAEHCYSCTAGAGSSCTGVLT